MYIYIHTYLKRFIYIYGIPGHPATKSWPTRAFIQLLEWTSHSFKGGWPKSPEHLVHGPCAVFILGKMIWHNEHLAVADLRGVSRPKWVIFPRLIADLIVDFPFSWLHSLVMSVMPNDCRFILYRHIYTLWEVHIFLLQHHASFYFCCFNRFLT